MECAEQETWEHDHFLLTEFGWSQVVFGSEATTEREDRHVGSSFLSRARPS